MHVLGMRIKQRCIQEQLVSPQQHVHMVSSAGGERMIPGEIGFVWSRVAGHLKPRRRLVKKTPFAKVCLRKFFLSCSSWSCSFECTAWAQSSTIPAESFFKGEWRQNFLCTCSPPGCSRTHQKFAAPQDLSVNFSGPSVQERWEGS